MTATPSRSSCVQRAAERRPESEEVLRLAEVFVAFGLALRFVALVLPPFVVVEPMVESRLMRLAEGLTL